MMKLHCDLCGRDMTYDENKTKVTWEDNNGYETSGFFTFRKPRRISADICDSCLSKLQESVKTSK